MGGRKKEETVYACLPKSLATLLVGSHVMLQRCSLALSQAVYIQNGYQVVQAIMGSKSHGLPHGTLRALAISQQAVHSIATQQN